ncbi:methyl-accepting chemotaxis protein [Ectopseudomonas mendocina]|uniref:Methyl-accepting chemotaxis protein n=1 Tax=Ectopseudomonas mendocina TaxID=300 RepID=A0A2R3QN65_ECTME|nr:methyl-accepting chemotaxis protein [Pseudomonas mendocina]AVO53231.1 methyl-accepting chemotaxis protein [Pseudomonas mendocina]
MYRWLANLSVGRKLMTGFGLLLLMSLLIFWAGWDSIRNLSYRMDRMSAVNQLMQDLSEMRLARAAYLQSGGDEKSVGELKQKIASIEQNLAGLRNFFTTETNRQKIVQMDQALASYQAIIQDLQAAYQQIAASRNARRSSGDQALAALDKLDGYVSSDTEDVLRTHERYKVVKTIQMQFLYARFETRAYTYSGKKDQYQSAIDAVDKTLGNLQPLRAQLSDAPAELFRDMEQSIRTYRDTLDTHQAALQRIDGDLQQAQQLVLSMVENCLALYENQMQQRTEDTRHAAWILLTCLALALVFGVASAALITRQIVPALRNALHNVQRIAGGDLSHQDNVQRTDEIGQLQQGVSAMASSLRQLIGHIGDGATQIASATEELSAITQQTRAGANEQKLETDQVATAMHEMATSVQDVARNAVETAHAVELTAQDASNGAQIVRKAIEQIDSLSGEVELTGEAISALAEESGRIGSMLDVIKSVAEQTNLLALNAAIEAARAGEAGRGFAVVADEVRGLAQRTQQSTQEIEALIAALQQGTLKAVQRMEGSRSLTQNSVALARQAGDALQSITASIGNAQGMTQQIAAAAEQQGAVAEEINRSVLNVRSITEQAYTASEQTSQASLELARLGSTLQSQVQRFRL